jgi:hypothetical protein
VHAAERLPAVGPDADDREVHESTVEQDARGAARRLELDQTVLGAERLRAIAEQRANLLGVGTPGIPVSGSMATIMPLVAGGAAFAWRFATRATTADGDDARVVCAVADVLALAGKLAGELAGGPAGAPARTSAVCEVTPAKASTPARVASATDTLRRGRINRWS